MNELAQVTPAYTTPFDVDEGFIFAWLRGWYIDDSDVALAKELGCFHGGGTWLLALIDRQSGCRGNGQKTISKKLK
jgi:hypothetical protein